MSQARQILRTSLSIGVGVAMYLCLRLRLGWPVYVGIVAAAFFLIVPTSLKLSIAYSAQPSVSPLDPEKLPPVVQAFFEKTAPGLIEDGFEWIGDAANVLVSGHISETSHYRVLHRAGTDLALVASQMAKAGTRTLAVQSVAFVTAFASGQRVITGNSKLKPTLASRAFDDEIRVPEIQDAQWLYRLHYKRCETLDATEARSPIPEPPAEALFRTIWLEQMDRSVRAGIYFLHPASQTYRLTWKGAFLTAWSHLWPISAILRSRQRSRNARLIREIGLASSS
ncbi:MAG: hypothetical protein JO317_06905 [Verrucomicrobiae bacterium]|nr:hypothetical protein [Verrucomicrobiae bacterium]